MQLGFSFVRYSVILLLLVAFQQVVPWTAVSASDTNVFLVRNGLQGDGYTATGVRAVKFRGNASLLLGTNANSCVLAIAVHHMEYVEDPTLRPTFRLVAYNPGSHKIVATLVEFTELEHVFNRNNHLIMHAYGTGMNGVDGASLDAIIDLTYEASASPAIPATPVRVSIQPLGTVKPTGAPGFNVPSTTDEGLVLFSTDDPAHPVLEVDVTGTGTGPSAGCNVNLSSTTLDFGTITVGTTNVQPLILRNNGAAACTVNGILLNGGSAFSYTAPATPFTLAAGSALTILVRYTTVTNVSDSAVLRITSTDPAAPQQYVTLSGGASSAPANITAGPGLLNFGAVQVGTNQTLNVTVVNRGGTVGTVTALSLGAASSIFTVSPATSFVLPPSSTQMVAVTYRPINTANVSSALQIQDSANHLLSISLVATGITPVCSLQVSATSLDFGAVNFGGSRSLSVSVKNTGLAPCSINGLNFSGSNNFTNFPNVTFPLAILPGASTNLSFSFIPTGGLVSGAATIFDSAGSTTISLSGSGAVTAPSCAVNVSQTSLTYGNVAVGGTNTQFFVISNTSATNCSVSALTSSGSSDFATFAPSLPFSLPAGSWVEVGVQYTPSGAGAASGALQVVTGDSVQPIVNVALTGTGVDPFIGLSTNNLQFGKVQSGSTITRTVRLSNPGGVNATIDSISIAGSPNFTLDPIVPQSQFELTNNATVTIPVTYVAPDYPSADVGAIIISNNVPGSPLIVTLNGTSLQSVLSLTLSNWTFGTVPLGTTNSVAVTINNTGNTNGTIETVEITGSGRYRTLPAAPITVGAGASTNLTIEFIPANIQTVVIIGGSVTSAGKPSKVSP